MHGMTCDHNRHCPVTCGQNSIGARWSPIHGDNGVRASGSNRPMRRTRAIRRPITTKSVPDVRSIVACATPPRLTTAHPWRPAPAEGVIVVPHPALIRHVPPRVTRGPDVPVALRIHPVSVAIWIPSSIGCVVGRPDVSLAGNVIPVSIRVQVVPRWVIAIHHALGSAGAGGGLRSQRLVAIGIPAVP